MPSGQGLRGGDGGADSLGGFNDGSARGMVATLALEVSQPNTQRQTANALAPSVGPVVRPRKEASPEPEPSRTPKA